MLNKWKRPLRGQASLFRVLLTVAAGCLLSGCNLVVFNPKGRVAADERDLIILATGLMLLVVIPVILMMFVFAYRYRATNEKAQYTPDWASSRKIEALVWGIPTAIILILSLVTWTSTHALDPYKPLDSAVKPLNVQVIAMDWKWLFIYPDLNIASVNELAVPLHTPVNFTITSDAAITSFFIPALGGQIYAMAGMQTRLHLIADEPGEFSGFAANYNGPGFSDMHFTTLAATPRQFEEWVQRAHDAHLPLDQNAYQQLARPGIRQTVTHYSAVDAGLFQGVVNKYEGMNTARPMQAPAMESK